MELSLVVLINGQKNYFEDDDWMGLIQTFKSVVGEMKDSIEEKISALSNDVYTKLDDMKSSQAKFEASQKEEIKGLNNKMDEMIALMKK